MKNFKLHSYGCFKHDRIWHLLPLPKFIIEKLPKMWYFTFEISGWHWSAYLTFQLNLK